MTDHELCMAAAKAAGYTVEDNGGWMSVLVDDMDADWEPLDENGDAFRLMVDCGLEVSCHDDYVDVSGYSGSAIQVEDYGTDKHAATRRAIVRAAADMGVDDADLRRGTVADEERVG